MYVYVFDFCIKSEKVARCFFSPLERAILLAVQSIVSYPSRCEKRLPRREVLDFVRTKSPFWEANPRWGTRFSRGGRKRGPNPHRGAGPCYNYEGEGLFFLPSPINP